jgi:hypothetical protein
MQYWLDRRSSNADDDGGRLEEWLDSAQSGGNRENRKSAAGAAIVLGLMPITKPLAAAAGVFALLARVAKRKGLALGLRIEVHGVPSNWRRPSLVEVLDLICNSLGGLHVVPFPYSPADPESLAQWRKWFRI